MHKLIKELYNKYTFWLALKKMSLYIQKTSPNENGDVKIFEGMSDAFTLFICKLNTSTKTIEIERHCWCHPKSMHLIVTNLGSFKKFEVTEPTPLPYYNGMEARQIFLRFVKQLP